MIRATRTPLGIRVKFGDCEDFIYEATLFKRVAPELSLKRSRPDLTVQQRVSKFYGVARERVKVCK